MPSQVIQWFPGHMAKTRRMITENLSNVDIVIELLDARIPFSSRNPEIKKLINGKPIITLLNKSSLADPNATAKWIEYFRSEGGDAIAIDCVNGDGLKKIYPAIAELLAEKLQRYKDKGMTGRKVKAMVLGIPNVGKSSLINRLSGGKKAKVENRPGVTLTKQWVPTSIGVDLLDMPGILWPKFDDKTTGENLAATGAIKDAVVDTETLASILCTRLLDVAPDKFLSRYKLDNSDNRLNEMKPYELLEEVGRKRGFKISGGDIDTERTANIVLEEFRSAKIGRITLEMPKLQPKKVEDEAPATQPDEIKPDEAVIDNQSESGENANA